MSDDMVYLIHDENLHTFRMKRTENGVFIESNGRHISFTPSMFEQLLNGCLALKSGLFNEVISETALRLRQADADYRARRAARTADRASPPTSKPELDQL